MTIHKGGIGTFASGKKIQVQEIKLISFTHKAIGIEKLGLLHIEDDLAPSVLKPFIGKNGCKEILFLSTCNRVEFLVVSDLSISALRSLIINQLYSKLSIENRDFLAGNCLTFEGIHAVKHFFKIASSLDSLVIGEREIITQVRAAYERCYTNQLCGDTIRLIIKKTIETAKQVFTETEVANRPVSVVNLAYRKLKSAHIHANSRVLIVGAGKTNNAMSMQLKKHGFGSFHVFNRTFSKAQELAHTLKGEAHHLSELYDFKGGFDVLISCTGSADTIVSSEIYKRLLQGETDKKTLVDLAVPNDIDKSVISDFNCEYISVESLKAVAEENMRERSKEIAKCELIIDSNIEEFEMLYRSRQIELAMREVPQAITEIKSRAMESVFANEINGLDANSKEVLHKVIAYMEKKYISMPMKMAKEIMLGELAKK